MKFQKKHGQCDTPEYRCWSAMKSRCLSPTHEYFEYYGGRGISIHPDWLDNFPAFLAHIGLRPSPAHSIDRHPNRDGNYEPGNVRWATKQEQTDNRDHTRVVEFEGVKQPLMTVVRKLGLPPRMVVGRVQRGWTPERAIAEPFQYHRGRPRCASSS